MNDPGLVLFDEPTAGLDVGGREELVADLTHWAKDPQRPPLVLVTHHLDEIRDWIAQVLGIKSGRVLHPSDQRGDKC
jgi:iron complex transport system ATP-binding protein